MEGNKKNYALWLYPETVRRMDSSMELANCQSRSEFVEKALHFYMGYLVTDDTTEYLSKALLTSIQGMLNMNDDRMRSLLFKLCVETNMMMHLPPATKRIVDAIVDELASDERVAEAYSLWQDMRNEVFSFYSKAKPERVSLSQQKEFKPVRNMVIREVVQMMEQQATLESAPPTPERRSLPPDSVSACMVRMLHHMGNIFRDNVGASGYRGLQIDRKRRKELQEWKIALGHREDDHEDPANYPTQSY